jgi:purine-nucleoside phosphorylase
MEFLGRSEFEAAVAVIQKRTSHHPRIGMVLGSGLGNIADIVEKADVIPYDQIPYWPQSTVTGHIGQLHIGLMEGQSVMVMRGRVHQYEGYPLSQVTLPIRVMQLLGIEMVILTNAAGGINPVYRPAELMMLTDHIALTAMTGLNPLSGPNDDTLGPRFPDMSVVYDPELCQLALDEARQTGVPMHQGVYICLAGPSFETPAEIRFLRQAGADAVGMSTVPEAIVARHGGLRVLAISGISNVHDHAGGATTHEEVLAAGKLIAPRMEAVIRGVLRSLTLKG